MIFDQITNPYVLANFGQKVNFPKRQPRINGDNRKRKHRLRKKLEKQDSIKYTPIIEKYMEAACRVFYKKWMDGIYKEKTNVL